MLEAIQALRGWYHTSVRPLLENLDPTRIESSDAECDRLGTLAASFTNDVPVCFLGQSGIGKSTLINALVGRSLLPQGGIGPLTAQVLSVRFGKEAAFEVRYHSPGKVGRLAFAIEQTYEAKLRKLGKEATIFGNEDLLDVLDQKDREDLTVDETEGESTPQEERNQEFIKQATLMIAGRQDAVREIPYLIDRLCETVAKAPHYGTVRLEEDLSRVQRLRERLILGKEQQPFRCLETSQDFRTALHEHAAGFFAPIISEFVVHWNAPILGTGIVLIDLPGVGIAGDSFSKVTEEYIREKAKVVVLVVSVKGVTKSDAELLRNSGFLNRLLFAADDPEADPVHLMIAVVRTDDIAEARRLEDKSRSKSEHFSDVCAEALQNTTRQMRANLANAWRTDETLSETKQEVLARIIDRLQVHPLSAIQYCRVLAGDADDAPFLKNTEESKVPNFRRSLTALSGSLNLQRRERLDRARQLFFSGQASGLRVLREQWQLETRAQAEAEALAEILAIFLPEVRKEFHTRRGEFRAFLRETVPAEIKSLVSEARDSARVAIRRYLERLEPVHWATLRATVRRGGIFYGARQINLPHDFALRFEEPLAEIWGKKLLQLIRKRTKEYASDCVALVERVLDRAKDQGARVKTTLIEAQRDQINADAQQLTGVGKELIDELREEVKNRLIASIQPPIRRRCEKFVERHDDIGTGVKDRMIELLGELEEEVLKAAVEPATSLLTTCFVKVEKEIAKVLRSDEDPIEKAAEAIVESHEASIRRGDAQRRKAVLRQLEAVETASPFPRRSPKVRPIDD